MTSHSSTGFSSSLVTHLRNGWLSQAREARRPEPADISGFADIEADYRSPGVRLRPRTAQKPWSGRSRPRAGIPDRFASPTPGTTGPNSTSTPLCSSTPAASRCPRSWSRTAQGEARENAGEVSECLAQALCVLMGEQMLTPRGGVISQKQLKVCQWLVPALTAGLEVLNALHGEQQRPRQQLPGLVAKLTRLRGIAA